MNDAIVAIIVALISGGLALVGTIISNKTTENKIQQQIITQQAVTDTKLEELAREVRKHNDFATRVPVVESEIKHIEDDLKMLHKYHED